MALTKKEKNNNHLLNISVITLIYVSFFAMLGFICNYGKMYFLTVVAFNGLVLFASCFCIMNAKNLRVQPTMFGLVLYCFAMFILNANPNFVL